MPIKLVFPGVDTYLDLATKFNSNTDDLIISGSTPTNGQLDLNQFGGGIISLTIPKFRDAINVGLQSSISGVSPAYFIDVTVGEYQVDAQVVSVVAPASYAVNAPDVVDPRIDILVADSAGVFTYIAGVAAPTPVSPAIPANNILITEIFVPFQGAGDPTFTADFATFTNGTIVGSMLVWDGVAWVENTDLNYSTATDVLSGKNLDFTNSAGPNSFNFGFGFSGGEPTLAYSGLSTTRSFLFEIDPENVSNQGFYYTQSDASSTGSINIIENFLTLSTFDANFSLDFNLDLTTPEVNFQALDLSDNSNTQLISRSNLFSINHINNSTSKSSVIRSNGSNVIQLITDDNITPSGSSLNLNPNGNVVLSSSDLTSIITQSFTPGISEWKTLIVDVATTDNCLVILSPTQCGVTQNDVVNNQDTTMELRSNNNLLLRSRDNTATTLSYFELYPNGRIDMQGGLLHSVTTVTTTPYVLLTSDYMLAVNTGTAKTITLPALPSTGRMIYIKDATGTAAANNITVNGNGQNLDGAATFVINNNYQSITIIYNGTQWSLI